MCVCVCGVMCVCVCVCVLGGGRGPQSRTASSPHLFYFSGEEERNEYGVGGLLVHKDLVSTCSLS